MSEQTTKDWEKDAAYAVIDNLRDRRGILDGIDDDVMEEIKSAIHEIIVEHAPDLDPLRARLAEAEARAEGQKAIAVNALTARVDAIKRATEAESQRDAAIAAQGVMVEAMRHAEDWIKWAAVRVKGDKTHALVGERGCNAQGDPLSVIRVKDSAVVLTLIDQTLSAAPKVLASSTYGDLPRTVQEMIEPHEWDNKTPSEQRDWAVARLAEMHRNWQVEAHEAAAMNARAEQAESQRDAAIAALAEEGRKRGMAEARAVVLAEEVRASRWQDQLEADDADEQQLDDASMRLAQARANTDDIQAISAAPKCIRARMYTDSLGGITIWREGEDIPEGIETAPCIVIAAQEGDAR